MRKIRRGNIKEYLTTRKISSMDLWLKYPVSIFILYYLLKITANTYMPLITDHIWLNLGMIVISFLVTHWIFLFMERCKARIDVWVREESLSYQYEEEKLFIIADYIAGKLAVGVTTLLFIFASCFVQYAVINIAFPSVKLISFLNIQVYIPIIIANSFLLTKWNYQYSKRGKLR